MLEPLVSVIIPCYNSEKYILETLNCILSQTYNNIEIIIVDDGSTDSSVGRIKEFITVLPNFKLITQSNFGVSSARRNAIEQANGKYILCLDSDDLITDNYIEKCVGLLEKEQDVSIVYSKARLFDAVDKEWRLPDFNLKSFLMVNCIFVTAMIRKDNYFKVGGFDPNLKMLEDWELFISIIKNGGKVYRFDKEMFFYRKRKNASSIMDTYSKALLSDSMLYIYHKHYEFYKDNGLYFQDFVNAKIKQDNKRKSLCVKTFYWLFNRKKYRKYYIEGK